MLKREIEGSKAHQQVKTGKVKFLHTKTKIIPTDYQILRENLVF